METTGKAGTFFEKYGTMVAVLVGALIIGGALVFGQTGKQEAGTGESVAVDIKNVELDNSPSIGPKGAKATVAIWFDYQCRYCKIFETTTLKQVLEVYGDDVRIVYKDFQFLGSASNDAALYSRAVWEAYPNRWEEWLTGMFAAGPDSEGTLSVSEMDALSTSLGLDVARLTSLRTDKKAEYQAAIDADREEGMSYGINGTPGTIIGTTLLEGAQPFDSVKALIDAELAK